MPRKIFRSCNAAFASVSFRAGVRYADSDRHELVRLRKLYANRQRSLSVRGCPRRTKFNVANLQDLAAPFFIAGQ
jgi:hypothetical protein